MAKSVPINQLSLDAYLAQHKWCVRHRRLDCRCGRTHKDFSDFEALILQVMCYRAAGRVPATVTWISIQLLIEYGINLTERTIRNHMYRLTEKGKVIHVGWGLGYQLAAIQ
jgi:DNA-binding transcriptional ArsR family regulator